VATFNARNVIAAGIMAIITNIEEGGKAVDGSRQNISWNYSL